MRANFFRIMLHVFPVTLLAVLGLSLPLQAHLEEHDAPDTPEEVIHMHEHAKVFCHLSQHSGSGEGPQYIGRGTSEKPLCLVNTAAPGYAPEAHVNLTWGYYADHPIHGHDFTVVVTQPSKVSYINGGDSAGTSINSLIDGMAGSVVFRVIHNSTGLLVEKHEAYWDFDPDACKDCGCQARVELGSIDVNIPLGETGYGARLNELTFYSAALENPGIPNLKFLGLPATGGSFVTYSGNSLATVETGNSLATITSTPGNGDANRFTIFFTYVNDPRPSPPSPVYREVVMGMNNGKFEVIETIGEKVRTYTYSKPNADKWVFVENEARRTTREKFDDDAQNRRFHYSIEEQAPDNTWKLVSRVNTEEYKYSWGWETVKSVTDPNGAALTSIFSYYNNEGSDPTDPLPGYGRIKREILPTGHERFHQYFDLGSGATKEVIKENHGAVAEGQETTITRTVVESVHIVMEEVRVFGNLVSKKEIIGSPNGRTEKVYPSENGAPLITTKAFTGGGFETIFPDGTREKSVETTANGLLTRRIFKGVKNPNSGHYLLRGVEREETLSWGGVKKKITEYHVENGIQYRIQDRTTTGEDERERPLEVEVYYGNDVSPAHSIYYAYGCCGLSQVTGRDGITSHYFYDALGRRWKAHRNGMAEETIRDGLTESRHRFPEALATGTSGADSSNLVSSTTKDLGGRIVSSRERSPKDGTLLTTTTSTAVNQANDVGTRVTRTLPATADDSGTPALEIEEYYPDGRMMTRSGNLLQGQRFTYASTTVGEVVTTARLNASGSPFESSAEQKDWAGRRLSVTYAGDKDGNQDPDRSQFFYDLSGKPSAAIDPDGVRAVYSDAPQTGVKISAVDLNANGTVDLVGDRAFIQRSGAGLDAANKVILWKETAARENNGQGQNVEKLLSRVETSADRLKEVSIQYGSGTQTGKTTRSTVLIAAGDWDTTTTSPDGTYIVDRIRGGVGTQQQAYSATGTLLFTRDFTLDGYQRVVSIADSRGPGTTLEYVSPLVDLVWRTTVGGTDITEEIRDERGRRTSVDRPNTLDKSGATVTNTRTFTYWPNGRLKEENGTPGHRSTYTYDDAWRLRTRTTYGDYTSISRWEYDADRGWLVAKRYNSPSDGNGEGETYTYTTAGRLKTRTNGRGDVATNTYDAGGTLATTSYDDSKTSWVYILERDPQGRPVRISDGGGERTLKYDGWGEIAAEVYGDGSVLDNWEVTHSRDSIGRLSQLAVRQSGTGISEHLVAYGYDNAGRLQTVASSGKNTSYHYNPTHGLLEQTAVWDGSAQVLYGTMKYDGLLRLQRLAYHNGQTSGSFGVFSDFSYTRDAAGKILTETAADGSSQVFAYTAAGEIASSKRLVTSGGSTYLAGQSFEWTYDGNGNRLSMKSGGDSAGANLRDTDYDTNALNQIAAADNPGEVDVIGRASSSATVTVDSTAASRQGDYFRRELTSNNTSGPVWKSVTVTDGTSAKAGSLLVPPKVQAFDHDADGNMESDGVYSYTWDAENRLIQIETSVTAVTAGVPYRRVAHTYDHEHRRVKTLVYDQPEPAIATAVTRYVWADRKCLAELGASEELSKRYTLSLDKQDGKVSSGASGQILWIDDVGAAQTHFSHFDLAGNLVGLSLANGTRTAEYCYSPTGHLIAKLGPYADTNRFRFRSALAEEVGDSYYRSSSQSPYYYSDIGSFPNRPPEVGLPGLPGLPGPASDLPLPDDLTAGHSPGRMPGKEGNPCCPSKFKRPGPPKPHEPDPQPTPLDKEVSNGLWWADWLYSAVGTAAGLPANPAEWGNIFTIAGSGIFGAWFKGACNECHAGLLMCAGADPRKLEEAIAACDELCGFAANVGEEGRRSVLRLPGASWDGPVLPDPPLYNLLQYLK